MSTARDENIVNVLCLLWFASQIALCRKPKLIDLMCHEISRCTALSSCSPCPTFQKLGLLRRHETRNPFAALREGLGRIVLSLDETALADIACV